MVSVKRTKVSKRKAVRKKTGILSNIVPFESSGELKMSIYGASGSGKTTFWSSFPGPILAILCSGGRGTNELDSISPEDRSKVEPYYLESCDDLLKIAKELETDTHYNTIVIDHLTGIQDKRIAEILGLDEIPVQKSWGLASRQQYGERALNLKTYLRGFMDLRDKKVVFISQETMHQIDEDAEKSDLDITPTIGPAVSDSVLHWFNPAANYIARTFVTPKVKITRKKVGKKVIEKRVRIPNEYDYCLWTGPSDIYTTKFRIPKEFHKPTFIKDPTYDSVMSLINGEYSGE